MKEMRKGEKVSWNTPQGKTDGHVVAKLTSDSSVGDHTVRATKDQPQYKVRSDKTGKEAVHKPESLQ